MNPSSLPVQLAERARILDILRGIALLGICVANYPMFSLYIFQPPDVLAAMPTAAVDRWIGYFHFAFIDGKFYSLFSLLFGIGFTIILQRVQQRSGSNSLLFFYRRIFILLLIGLAHLLLLWEGDILMLYAIIGLLLPLFRNLNDRTLLILFVVLILVPILIDTVKVLSENRLNISNPLRKWGMEADKRLGITESNFSTWLVKHDSYGDLLRYNQVGIIYRYQGLLDNNRFFKVLGMFLLGLYVGRKMLYIKLEENKPLLKRVQRWGFLVGLPFSILHAWAEMHGERLPASGGLINTVAYAFSVVPMSLAYTSTICLWYIRSQQGGLLNAFAAPGRMALTNYILQTIIAITIFYGIGFGLGATMGVTYVVLISIVVYISLMMLSHWWLQYFRYGPLEWIWRMLTYGKLLPLKKQASAEMANA